MRNYIMLAIIMAVAILVPIVSSIIWKIKTGTKVLPFLVGALVWMLFVMIFEQGFHYLLLIVLGLEDSALFADYSIYIIYAALTAALFEELGRYFAFKLPLRKHNRFKNSVAYGLGHGGFELAYILLSAYLPMLLAMCGFSFEDESIRIMYMKQFWEMDIKMTLLFLGERLVYLLLHIGLSILIFYSVNGTHKGRLFFRALFLHFVLELMGGLNQMGIISVTVFEVTLVCITLLIFVDLYRKGLLHSVRKA